MPRRFCCASASSLACEASSGPSAVDRYKATAASAICASAAPNVRANRLVGAAPKSAAPATNALEHLGILVGEHALVRRSRPQSGSEADLADLLGRQSDAGGELGEREDAGSGAARDPRASPTSEPSRAAYTICSIVTPCDASHSRSSRRSVAFGAFGS